MYTSRRTHSKKSNFENTLHDLIKNGNVRAVKDLLANQNTDVNAREKNYDLTPLHVASELGETEILKLLIEAQAELNPRNHRERTPLHLAKDSSTAKILLDSEADINMRSCGSHMLRTAVDRSNLSVIKFLITSCKIDANVQDNNGYTLLHAACTAIFVEKDYNTHIVKFLLKNNANINNFNCYKLTPLCTIMVHHKMYGRFNESVRDDPKVYELLRLLLKYSDLNLVRYHPQFNEKLCMMYLERVALLLSCGVHIHSHLKIINQRSFYKKYFEQCTDELILARNTKFCDSWLTVYNFLVDDKNKLKNYAGNRDLMSRFQNWNDYSSKFPIYVNLIKKNVSKGMERRKFFDEACILLSDCLPILNPMHLIVRDTLDCTSTKDLSKFSMRNSISNKRSACT